MAPRMKYGSYGRERSLKPPAAKSAELLAGSSMRSACSLLGTLPYGYNLLVWNYVRQARESAVGYGHREARQRCGKSGRPTFPFVRFWTSQDLVDSPTPHSGRFKLFRTHSAQMAVAPRWIVKRFDIV